MARLKYLLWLLVSYRPIAGAEDDPPKDDPPADPPKDDPPKDPPDDPIDKDDDWQTKARKHERDLKKERDRAAKLEKDLKDREDADKSEQQKEIDKAREEGRTAAQTEADKERRKDRLEVAVTRLASKGITIGDGDEKKTVRFADSEDALLHIQRDADDLFTDDGKVDEDALKGALADLLKRKPHFIDGDGKPPPADPDARKGEPPDNDMESWTPEQHAQRKYGTPTEDAPAPLTGAKRR